MKSLRANRTFLQQQVASAKSLFLFVDYDGTLTPLADHPSHARLQVDTKRLLRRSAGLPGVRVALVSGRALRDLKRMVGIRGLYYVGNHGLELEGPNLHYVNPIAKSNRPLLKQIAGKLKAALRAIPGAWVEEKGLTVSIHWRRVPQSASRTFHRLVGQCLSPYLTRGAVRLIHGKRVIEVRPPVGWDKGKAVAWLLSRLGGGHVGPQPLAMYFGDDRTDEDAFRVVNRLRGLSVVVGRPTRGSAARYWLKDVREVKAWLQMLGQALPHANIKAQEGGLWIGDSLSLSR